MYSTQNIVNVLRLAIIDITVDPRLNMCGCIKSRSSVGLMEFLQKEIFKFHPDSKVGFWYSHEDTQAAEKRKKVLRDMIDIVIDLNLKYDFE